MIPPAKPSVRGRGRFGWWVRRIGRRLLIRGALAATLGPAVAQCQTPMADWQFVSPDVAAPDRASQLAGWWVPVAQSPMLGPGGTPLRVEEAIAMATADSPRIAAACRQSEAIAERVIQQDAAFDSVWVANSGLTRTNDPVGNTLTTGGPPRLIDRSIAVDAGVRKRTRGGTQWQVGQSLGVQDSNSVFFDPLDQGNARLNLSLTRPLMASSGRAYTTRLVRAAQIDSRIAWQQMHQIVGTHLVETVDAFYRLREARCLLAQDRDLLARGERLSAIVVGRQSLDSSPAAVAKVQLRQARRRARIVMRVGEVQNAQSLLELRLGQPGGLGDSLSAGSDDAVDRSGGEWIPIDDPPAGASPRAWPTQIDRTEAMALTLQHRPEIAIAVEQLAAAGLEVQVTRNELRPRLDAVFGAYVSGLRGENDFSRSFADQFDRGGPGINGSLVFERPTGRRLSRSRHREAQRLYQQRAEELRLAMLAARQEVETALTGLQTATQLLALRDEALRLAVREEAIATSRLEALGGGAGPLALVIEDVLETQRRRTDAEAATVAAEVQWAINTVLAQRAMGTFLQDRGLVADRPVAGRRIDWSTPTTLPTVPTLPLGEARGTFVRTPPGDFAGVAGEVLPPESLPLGFDELIETDQFTTDGTF